MPTRLFHLLLLATALCATGATLVALSGGIRLGAVETVPIAAPTLLPTVIVRPETEMPTLATITVRADPIGETVALASPLAPRAPLHAVLGHSIASFASGGAAGSGFGMPYYSFGKPQRRAGEE